MTQNNEQPIHPMMKAYAGLDPDTPDDEVRKYFDDVFPAEVEKPCGVLLWCPYGPLVEDFPLHPEANAYAAAHGKFVRWNPTPLRTKGGEEFPGFWDECEPEDEGAVPDLDYGLNNVEELAACAVFGHDCPAFYVAEPFADPQAVVDNCICDECRAKAQAESEQSNAQGTSEQRGSGVPSD